MVTRARDDSRDVWEKGITFAEEYFRDHDFERMFVEIPGKDPVLLGRAYDLGFIESIDAVPKGEFFTYLVNKELEREKDAKFGSSSK